MNHRVPTLRASALANYLGQGWSAFVGLVFLPLYLGILGLESYALVGIFAVLQAWLAVLDLGLTPTLNREMARLRAGAHTPQSIRNLLRSLELVCGGVMALTIFMLWLAAPWLATHWLQIQGLPTSTVVDSLRLMALVLGIRLFEQVFRGALQGIQDQVWLNSVSAVLATLRWGGAYLLISQVSSTVFAFFVWQGVVSILAAIVLANRLYQLLPASDRKATFDRAAFVEVYGFARGMFFGSVLAFLLTQSDKLAVSKLLPLGELGYYTLAATVAGALMQFAVPLNATIYPRLTMQVANGDEPGLRRTYENACQWMATIVIPPALILAFFPDLVLSAWSGNRDMALRVAPLLRILVLGQLANALVNMPYLLQLAHGWTGLAIRINAIAVFLFVPLVVWAVPRFGGVGAASVWLVLNLGYLSMMGALMHRRLLPNAARGWYRDAVVLPLAVGATAVLVVRLAKPDDLTRGGSAIFLLSATMLVLFATGAAVPATRRWAALVTRSFLLVLHRRDD